jgi:hypothetical protein
MKTRDADNLFAVCLVAACTNSLGKLWAESCSSVLDAVVANVADTIARGASEAVTPKGLPRGRSMPIISTRGGRGL